MAVTIPTKTALYNQILNDIAGQLGVDASYLGDTYKVPAKVQAGMIYHMYLALSAVQKNIFYDLCEESVLIRYGSIILGRKPSPAEAGVYNVQVTGTIGATIPASTTFKANDDVNNSDAAGTLFILDEEYTLVSETDTISLRSLEPGTDAALIVGDLLTSTSPITNVDSEVEVTEITTDPVEAEDISSYRDDLIEQAQIEPQGGSPGDYRLWAQDVPEVRTIYPYAKEGNPGDLVIYVEATEENSATGDITGVPTQTTIDDVYLNDDGVESGAIVINSDTGKGRKPIGVFSVDIEPVNPVKVDIDFTNLTDTSIIDTIRSTIDDLFYDIRPFVAGADVYADKNDILTLSKVIAEIIAVLDSTDITYEDISMNVDYEETTKIQFLLGDYPYLSELRNNGEIL